MIKIEKNIPIARTVFGVTYPFSEMEIGDSFAVKVDTPDQLAKKRSGVSTAAFNDWINNKRKFTVRTLSPTTIRVWRIL